MELGVVSGCGLLSLRMGDVFLEVLGLVPADGDVVSSPPESCFRSGGGAAVVGVAACEDDFLVSLVLRRGAELLAVFMLATSGGAVAAAPAPESRPSGLLLAMVEVVCCGRGEMFAHHPTQGSAVGGAHGDVSGAMIGSGNGRGRECLCAVRCLADVLRDVEFREGWGSRCLCPCLAPRQTHRGRHDAQQQQQVC